MPPPDGSRRGQLGFDPELEPLLAPVPGSPGADVSQRIQRVGLAAGALNECVMHPQAITFERLYRRQPEQGIHNPDISDQNPFVIEMGAFRVLPNQCVFLFDIRPDVYRFSGADPFDFVPFERRRFSAQLKWQVFVNGTIPMDLRIEITPIPRQFQQNALLGVLQPGEVAPATLFEQARFNRAGASDTSGLASLPQRPTKPGARNVPMLMYIDENQVFEAKASVIRPIQSPVAMFEFDAAGVILPKQVGDQVLRMLRPMP